MKQSFVPKNVPGVGGVVVGWVMKGCGVGHEGVWWVGHEGVVMKKWVGVVHVGWGGS